MGLLDRQDTRFHFADQLLGLNGTFWQMYGDTETPDAIMKATEIAEWQMIQTQAELLDCATYNRVPVFHKERWYPLVVRESVITQHILQFGEGAVFGPQPLTGKVYRIGIPDVPPLIQLPLGEAVVHLPIITSGITSASVAWFEGIDYTVRSGVLELTHNPFDYAFPIRDIYADGVLVDREITLWCHQASLDRRYASDHFGFLFGINEASSPSLQLVIESLYEADGSGTTDKELKKLVTGATGVAFAAGDETVDDIQITWEHLYVITDKNVYRYHPTATPVVSIGEKLVPGQELVASVRFYDIARGEVPDALQGIAIEQDMLSELYTDGLLFENKLTDLITTTVDDYTRVSFELGGFKRDVQLFWNEVHSRGIAAAETLAHLLDKRANPVGEPTAASLPASVNPLQFLITNVLRFSAFVLKVNVTEARYGAGIHHLQLLRRMLPPWYMVIVIFEVQLAEEVIIMGESGTPDKPGGIDLLSATYGSDPQVEYIDPTVVVQDQLTASYSSFACK